MASLTRSSSSLSLGTTSLLSIIFSNSFCSPRQPLHAPRHTHPSVPASQQLETDQGQKPTLHIPSSLSTIVFLTPLSIPGAPAATVG